MKKIIDEKRYEIGYSGNVEELKIQLESFYESFGMILDKELEDLEKIVSDKVHFGSIEERIYYNNKRLLYRANSSDIEKQRSLFPIMKKRAEEVDEKILEKIPNYSLEIEKKNSKF